MYWFFAILRRVLPNSLPSTLPSLVYLLLFIPNPQSSTRETVLVSIPRKLFWTCNPIPSLRPRFTIYNELGHLDNIVVTMVGDLKYGRTVHSLARLLAFYNVRLNYVAPASLQMPESVESELAARGVSQHKTESLTADILKETDILYMTRIQQERFASQEEYLKYKGVYVIDKALVLSGKPTMRVMHPLPRVGEITEDVDELPQAAFFREMENGMYTRMAIIALVTGTANEVCEMEL